LARPCGASPRAPAFFRTKGEAGTGNVVEAVRHIRILHKEIKMLQSMDDGEIFTLAKEMGTPVDFVMRTKRNRRLPGVNFAACGVATPTDAAPCMHLGVDYVFVGSDILKPVNPEERVRANVKSVMHIMDLNV